MGILYTTMRTSTGILLLVIFYTQTLCRAESNEEEGAESKRNAKVLPVFQVVKFPNDICAGSTRNGTCYTAEECSTKGGSNEGSCASGFGVCCTFVLACGGSSSENQTYIVQSSVTSLTSPCTYSICPCSTNICRIRYDFTTLTLASQNLGTTVAADATAPFIQGANYGDCITDQFSITAGTGTGTPVICGTNSGYHMIVDSDYGSSECQKVNVNVGGGTATTRSWNIRVTQYGCGQTDESGPPGCLQYYTGTAGSVQSFGFPTGVTTVAATTTHLSSQKYDVCFRRAANYCYICYTVKIESDPLLAAAVIGDADVNDQKSFGLSTSVDAANPENAYSEMCTTDYIDIPGAISAINVVNAVVDDAGTGEGGLPGSRLCGRLFTPPGATLAANADAAPADQFTVCTRTLPFKIGVNFDDSEEDDIDDAASMLTKKEEQGAPGGIVGFAFNFWQVTC